MPHKTDTTLTVSGASSTSGITYYIDTNNPPTTKQSSVSITSNTSSTTYYARACNGAGICGEITSYELKLDETKPGVPTLAIGDNIASGNWHIKDFILSLSGANNISGYTYYIDTNSNPTTARNSVSVTSNTASTTYYYKVCSGSGICSNIGNYVAKLDKTTSNDLNLKTTITASDNKASGSWHTADTTLTVSGASSTSGITYYIDTNNPPTTKTSSVSVTSNTSSTTYYARACNGAGTCGAVSNLSSYVMKLDETTPTVSVAASDSKGSGSWHNANFNINLSGANNISGYTYYIDTNSNPTTARSSVTVSTNTASTTYYYKACSGAGKCSTVGSYVAKLDKSTPTITAKSSSNYITTSTGKAISSYFNISYGVSSGSVICKVGSTTVSNTNNLSLGANTVTCTATSGAGLTKSASTVFRHQYTATITCSKGTYSSSSGKCEDDWYDSCYYGSYCEDTCEYGCDPDYVCGSECTAYNYTTECGDWSQLGWYETPNCPGCSCEVYYEDYGVLRDWECCWEEQGSCKSWKDVWCDGSCDACYTGSRCENTCEPESGTDYYDPTYSCPHGGTRSGTTCSF